MSSLLIDRKIVFNEAGDYSEDYLDGRLHLVVNGVGIAEGVWNGSEGGVLYEAAELRNSDPGWDHKPAVLKHPKDANGSPVSAASSAVLNASRVGLLLNTATGDDGKQRYKVWIDVDKANSVDARIVQNIKSKTKVEVSTGMMAELVKKKGVWNGKPYQFVAKNIKPDHLAILLDEPGAYSVADGGGLLANSSSTPPLSQEAIDFLTPGIRTWLANTGLLVNGSLEETRYKLARLLATTYGDPGRAWNGYVEATFADKVVFSKDYGTGYMLVGYEVTDDGVKLVGEAVQVTSVQGYRSPDGSTLMVNSSGEPQTVQETDLMSKHKGHIDQLITNGQYLEQQRGWLESLGDGVTNIAQVAKTTAPILNQAVVPTTPAPAPATPDVSAFLAQLAASNPDMAYVLNQGAAQVESRRAVLVNTIKAAPGNKFTEEWLKTQRIEFLEGVAALIPQQPAEFVVNTGVQSDPPMFALQNAFIQQQVQRTVEEPLVADSVEDTPKK